MFWPAASGLILFFIALYSIPTFDLVTNVVGMGGIAVGAIPLFLNRKQIWKRPVEAHLSPADRRHEPHRQAPLR